jgi:hypothetical protein
MLTQSFLAHLPSWTVPHSSSYGILMVAESCLAHFPYWTVPFSYSSSIFMVTVLFHPFSLVGSTVFLFVRHLYGNTVIFHTGFFRILNGILHANSVIFAHFPYWKLPYSQLRVAW